MRAEFILPSIVVCRKIDWDQQTVFTVMREACHALTQLPMYFDVSLAEMIHDLQIHPKVNKAHV